MTLVIRLDEFMMRGLICEACTKPLKRRYKNKMYCVQCPNCDKLWTERDIRNGKASGLIFQPY